MENNKLLFFQRLVFVTRPERKCHGRHILSSLRPCCIIFSSQSGTQFCKNHSFFPQRRGVQRHGTVTHAIISILMFIIYTCICTVYTKCNCNCSIPPWYIQCQHGITHSGIWCASDTQAYCLQVSLFVLSNNCPVLRDPTFRQLFSNNQLLCGTFHVRLEWSEAFRSVNREKCVKMLPRIAPLISQQLRHYLM